MTEIQRAMLGDKEAQRQITERGELLPCPFCGGAKIRLSNWAMWRCWCSECFGKSDDELWKKDAIERWNTRALILTMEQIDALEAMEHDA